MRATLLVELLTEELPPKSLRRLSEAFSGALLKDLAKAGLRPEEAAGARSFATPRRLAVSIPGVAAAAEDRVNEVNGPPASAPAAAVAGFAKKHGIAVQRLERRAAAKGEVFVARVAIKGALLDELLAAMVTAALKSLPVAKVMRWGSGEAQFVRPAHGLVMMHGRKVVHGEVLGIASSNRTRGHRFMGKGEIALASAHEYESKLRDEGCVIADFAARRAEVSRQLETHAARRQAKLGEVAELLDEVTALVEYPQVYAGGFDPVFLEVPQECLILTMRQHQKYFPLFDPDGKLLPSFLIVSNMKIEDPRHIIAGNERVVRPRLEDARFFYEQDRKLRLETRVPRLGEVVYHRKLGTLLERTERLQLLAGTIARALAVDALLAERAAWLCKADLLTGMVGEFPELQGVMGRYYALHDGEPREVADAIEAHYRPRFAGDALPERPIGCAVALADKLDSLAGLFAIGETPTGERDPFGLRRAALGVIRILVERELELSLSELVKAALAGHAAKRPVGEASMELRTFIFERARGYFEDHGYSANEVESVLCLAPGRFDLIPKQLEAVRAFSELTEAQSLAAANKRIANILKQASGVPSGFDSALMSAPEEKTLEKTFRLLKPDLDRAFSALDYTQALKTLASLKTPVDAFFDKVMVMDEDPKVRANRIGFLATLHGTMNRIADISKLAK